MSEARSSKRRVPDRVPGWRPPAIAAVVDDFDTLIDADDLYEGCRRLGVEPAGIVQFGYTRRSVGVCAVGSDASRSWVKVSALRGSPIHWLREGELSAGLIPGVPMPALLARCNWVKNDAHYLALKMTSTSSPVIEPVPWAGWNAQQVSDAWIAALKSALAALGKVRTKRSRFRPGEIARMIADRFGARAPNVAEEWRIAHGDLQWSNLTAPDLTLLDWECWGRAPRGYDAAYLIAVSCTDPILVNRLERAFADDLETASGRVARLAALAILMGLIDGGWLDPAYKPHLEAMARRVLADGT